MPDTGRLVGRPQQRAHIRQLRERAPDISTHISEAIGPVLREQWDVSAGEVDSGTDAYVSALLDALESDSVDPVVEYIESLDSLWRAEQFAIDPLIRCLFIVRDVAEQYLPDEYRDEGAARIETSTRAAIETLSRRSVSIVTQRLAEQVERHRDGEARLMGLQRVAATLVSDLDLDRSLALIAEEARRLIHADGVGIRLQSDSGDTLDFISGSGDDDQTMRATMRLPIDDSVSGTVFRSGEPVRINDIRANQQVNRKYVDESNGRSMIITPLLARDRPIGIIGGASARVAAFSEQDEQILTLFADQAASAIQNAQLYKQAQEQIEELEMLHRVSHVISSSLELDEIFQTLFEEVARLMPADAFVVALSRPDGLYDVEFVIDQGKRYPPERGIRISPVFEVTIRDGDVVVMNDVQRHDSAGRVDRVGNQDHPAKSLIAAPLIRVNQQIGMVSAQSYDGHVYGATESRMLQTIANHAAVAIEHARLYQRAQHAAVAEERTRLAREIHDTLAQGLIGVILCLEHVDGILPAADTDGRQWVERALELSRSSLDEARRSVRDLRAAPLEGKTLLEALGNLVANVSEDVNFEIDATLPPTLPKLSARVETALFRIVQEAIVNASKHAECSRLQLLLYVDETTLTLRVSDDGIGFGEDPIKSPKEHYGLTTMRERVQQIGGQIEIKSAVGQGTHIRVDLPVRLAIHQESRDDDPGPKE